MFCIGGKDTILCLIYVFDLEHIWCLKEKICCTQFGCESLFSDLIMFLQRIDSLSVLGLSLKLKLKLLSVGPLNNNSRLLLIFLPVAL